MAGRRGSKGSPASPARRKGERRRLRTDPGQIVYMDRDGIHTGLPERRSGRERRRANAAKDRR